MERLVTVKSGPPNVYGPWHEAAYSPVDIGQVSIEFVSKHQPPSLVDVGVGEAGAELVIIAAVASTLMGKARLPIKVPQGARIALRHKSPNNGTDARVRILIHVGASVAPVMREIKK